MFLVLVCTPLSLYILQKLSTVPGSTVLVFQIHLHLLFYFNLLTWSRSGGLSRPVTQFLTFSNEVSGTPGQVSPPAPIGLVPTRNPSTRQSSHLISLSPAPRLGSTYLDRFFCNSRSPSSWLYLGGRLRDFFLSHTELLVLFRLDFLV